MALIQRECISQNPYLTLFMTGKMLTDEKAIPLFARRNFEMFKERLSRVSLEITDLESYLSTHERPFDFMNLSDLFEYLSAKESHDLFSLIARRLKPGGAIGYWTLLVDRLPSLELALDKELSKKLSAADRTWFYADFRVARKPLEVFGE